MLRIVSANLNGIRSADKKGFFDWLATIHADFVCVQELKAQAGDLSDRMRNPDGLTGYFHYAEKKGYSGAGVYARRQPDAVVEGLGVDWIDADGRFLQLDFGHLPAVSLYLPSGSSSDERQQVKFDFHDVFVPHLELLRDAVP
ncbi:exodeoxyribonuclease III, partial [Pseudomonas sp. MWU12-2115]|uniref:endonuclease/exonuclease/phosphatase family protein n=1 Tax=Pseudomonas sp. MWU12-2115 TaxID=2071713 RepID=UPI000DF975C0